jgi:hypothetical protein
MVKVMILMTAQTAGHVSGISSGQKKILLGKMNMVNMSF